MPGFDGPAVIAKTKQVAPPSSPAGATEDAQFVQHLLGTLGISADGSIGRFPENFDALQTAATSVRRIFADNLLRAPEILAGLKAFVTSPPPNVSGRQLVDLAVELQAGLTEDRVQHDRAARGLLLHAVKVGDPSLAPILAKALGAYWLQNYSSNLGSEAWNDITAASHHSARIAAVLNQSEACAEKIMAGVLGRPH